MVFSWYQNYSFYSKFIALGEITQLTDQRAKLMQCSMLCPRWLGKKIQEFISILLCFGFLPTLVLLLIHDWKVCRKTLPRKLSSKLPEARKKGYFFGSRKRLYSSRKSEENVYFLPDAGRVEESMPMPMTSNKYWRAKWLVYGALPWKVFQRYVSVPPHNHINFFMEFCLNIWILQ